VSRDIVACAECPRLRRHCEAVAAAGKREFAGWTYWGKPVPGFGDARPQVLIVGLAPAAHGANRTGRMFTGDGSATWLIRAMHRAGFATQPTSVRRGDVRCAPPGNRPQPQEIARCARFLLREWALLTPVRVVVPLGLIAFEACRRHLRTLGAPVAGMRFAHGAVYAPGGGFPTVVCSYHPSRQNTNTGRLTEAMLDQVFQTVRALVDDGRGRGTKEAR
jgi:uracil-DNA glycosylase